MTDNATRTKQDAERAVLSVTDVALRLGVTPDAIRARLHRGTLEGEKQGGEWRVFFPVEETSASSATEVGSPETRAKSVYKEPAGRQDTKQDSTGKQPDQTGKRQDADSPLIAAIVAAKDETISRMADEVAFLRNQLDHRSRELADERERSDVLHREAFARIEALTTGLIERDADDQTEPESPQTHDVGSERTEALSPGNDESNAGSSRGQKSGFAR